VDGGARVAIACDNGHWRIDATPIDAGPDGAVADDIVEGGADAADDALAE
jgi:hypothetical protein